MVRSSRTAVIAGSFGALALLGLAPGFVPSVTTGAHSTRGTVSTATARSADLAQSSSVSSYLAAGVLAACAFTAVRRHGSSSQRTQVKAVREDAGVEIGGSVVTYAKALMDVAAKTKESGPVAQDVLRMKELLTDEDWLDKLLYIQNERSFNDLQKAQEMIKILGLKSKAVPKFIIFLAKRKRLVQIKRIVMEYVQALYETQRITPVRVVSAEKLTSAQLDKIKQKMKAKTNSKDIKLVTEVDPSLLGGVKIEWDFVDQDRMISPASGLDLSLSKSLKKAALAEGIVV